MSKKIFIMGAGRIGRGFVADLFYNAGYRIVFADASQALIDGLNEAKQYTVLKYKSKTDQSKDIIKDFTALHTSMKTQILDEMTDCNLMALAVFPGIFDQVAAELTEIIHHRIINDVYSPLDVILCANIFSPSKLFTDSILPMLGAEERKYFDEYIGVIDSLVIRMAVEPSDEMLAEDPLVVLTNGYEEITLDKTAFKGSAPDFEGIVLTGNIHAEEVRKMYTYNMVHALYAYLGLQKGYSYVEESTRDEEIQQNAKGALNEVAQALIKEFSFTETEMEQWNVRVMRNMANPILKDKVVRVGGDPIRKLKKQDRLCGPALMCKDNGVLPYYLTKAIAYGFIFDIKEDMNAQIVKEYAEYYGIKAAAQKFCELNNEPELLEMIAMHYERAIKGEAEDPDKAALMKKAFALGFDSEKTYKGCAQCALLAFFKMINKEDEGLFQSASGFSGGMAISGDGVCGGYSGGVMAMGSIVGRRIKEMKKDGDKEAQYTSYVMAQELRDKFLKTYGSVTCGDIHNKIFCKSYCLRTKAVRNEFEEAGAHTNKCTTVVGMSSAWLAEILYDHGYLI